MAPRTQMPPKRRVTQSKAVLLCLVLVFAVIMGIRYIPPLIPQPLSNVMANPLRYMDQKVRVRGTVLNAMEVAIPGGKAACVQIRDDSGSGWLILPRVKTPEKGRSIGAEVYVSPNPFPDKIANTQYVYMQVQRSGQAK